MLCCGCIAQRGFPCEQQSDCVLEGLEGWCEQPVGYCSYPDDACASRRRFESMAGDGLAGECVAGGESGTGGELGCDWQSLYAGDLHVCALDGDGSVWCWGANEEGQLGTAANSLFEADARQTVPPVMGIVSIAAGPAHTCALGSQGEVWCWGRNTSGQVSWPRRNSDPAINEPTRIEVPIVPSVLLVGPARSCVSGGDRAYCWGDLSQADQEFLEVQLPGPVLWAASGEAHVCVSVGGDQEGVHCQGSNASGQLGQGMGVATDSDVFYSVDLGLPVRQIAAGRSHTCAIHTRLSDGQEVLACWGDDGKRAVGKPRAGNGVDADEGLGARRYRPLAGDRGVVRALVRARGDRRGLVLGRQHLRPVDDPLGR